MSYAAVFELRLGLWVTPQPMSYNSAYELRLWATPRLISYAAVFELRLGLLSTPRPLSSSAPQIPFSVKKARHYNFLSKLIKCDYLFKAKITWGGGGGILTQKGRIWWKMLCLELPTGDWWSDAYLQSWNNDVFWMLYYRDGEFTLFLAPWQSSKEKLNVHVQLYMQQFMIAFTCILNSLPIGMHFGISGTFYCFNEGTTDCFNLTPF
jgi:hypothetical protein